MEDSLKRRGINKNNLLPWFLQDHGTLPAGYLKSCEKFFRELGRVGPKATSSQAKKMLTGSSQAVMGYYNKERITI